MIKDHRVSTVPANTNEADSDRLDVDVKESSTDTPAERALREAEVRRAKLDTEMAQRPKEVDGRGGLEPTRYGDWEIKGISSDF